MSDNSAPTHRAYVISQPREKGGKGFWHEVGVVWPPKSSNGFDVVLYEGISIHGRIVCTAAKDKELELTSPQPDIAGQDQAPQLR